VGDTTNRSVPTRVYDASYDDWGDDTWRQVAAWGSMSLAVLDIGANEWPVSRTDSLRSWGQQNNTRYGFCSGSGMQCNDGPDFVYYQTLGDMGIFCANDDACGDGAGCFYTGQWRCFSVNAYVTQPRRLLGPVEPDDPIISISAGPFISATWGHVESTGGPFQWYRNWVPTYSVSGGYNQHGETGRGPGGDSICYNIGDMLPRPCYRYLGTVVDDNTEPFLNIEKGRGIGAPPQAGVLDNPPPILGELNVWGANDAGQLGLGAGSPDPVSEPELMPEHPLP